MTHKFREYKGNQTENRLKHRVGKKTFFIVKKQMQHKNTF